MLEGDHVENTTAPEKELVRLTTGRGVKRARIDCNVMNECDELKSKELLNDANLSEDKFKQTETNTFKPIYIICEWEDKGEEQGVTVAIPMPSGSFESPRYHDLKVSEDGTRLELTATWKGASTDLNFLHKCEIDFYPKKFEQHPRVLSFRSFPRKLRSKAGHKISSSCNIPLLIQVKRDIALGRRCRKFFEWHITGQKVLYVTLEAPDKDYAVDDEGVPEVIVA